MNHVDRVRAFLRTRQENVVRGGNLHPEYVYSFNGHTLTVSDLDALCRDAERLQEVEDL